MISETLISTMLITLVFLSGTIVGQLILKLRLVKIERENLHLIFGHWAALGGKTDNEKITAIDTGCVWGYKLSAYRLEDSKVFSYDRITK